MNKLSSILFRYKTKSKKKIFSSKELVPSVELHINFWDIDEKLNNEIMDFGIFFKKNEFNEKNIIINLPGNYTFNDVDDLGEMLLIHPRITSSIFNETIKSNINSTIVLDDKYQKKFTIISVNIKMLIFTYYEENNYTDIEIPIRKIINSINEDEISESCYIRFRINNIKKSNFICKSFLKDAGILSSPIQRKTIDFKVNTRRGLPVHVSNNFLDVTKLHCFLIIQNQYDLLTSDKNYITYRSLFEEDSWELYLNQKFKTNVKECNGYQWTKIKNNNDKLEENGLKDITIIGSFSRYNSSFFSISRSVIFLIITGILSSAIMDIYYNYKNLKDDIFIIVAGIFIISFLILLKWIESKIDPFGILKRLFLILLKWIKSKIKLLKDI